MKKYAFGVDIGGTSVKIGFFETTGKLLSKWEIPTNTANNGAVILDDIVKAIEGKMAEENITRDDVQGIGMGVPGPVTDTGVVNKCVNLNWGVFNVEEEMSKKSGMYVKAGNDANVATLGEMWQGGAKGYQNVVMLTLGTGVGAGVIIGGKVVAGTNGAGGEIGHMKVNADEADVCGCGKKGCLEQYTSANGNVRVALKAMQERNPDTCLNGIDNLTSKDIYDAAEAGDAFAMEMVEYYSKVLGDALGTVACCVDPEIFVIGGGVSKSGPIVTDTVQKYFKANTFHACENAKFALASLGNDAGMYGCARLVIEG